MGYEERKTKVKVLFLDVDGVLNMYGSGGYLALNKRRLRNLQRVVDETSCRVVVSSTWRKLPDTMKRLKSRLAYRGIKIYGATRIDYFKERQIRGDEIKDWLDNHPDVESYAIVDDDSDMLEEQFERFVQTDGAIGLVEEKADELIGILNNGSRIYRSHGERPESS